MTVLITGSLGLVGSTTAQYFLNRGDSVIGVDNDMRGLLFGYEASVKPALTTLEEHADYLHYSVDLRDGRKVYKLLAMHHREIDLVVHTAAQPSHDWSAQSPLSDFDINVRATVLLLEAMRTYELNAPFVFLSTNKVYGDTVNRFEYEEYDYRYDVPDSSRYYDGIDETFMTDRTMHSPFGAGKLSADTYVQEYGRYFGLPTVCFRCGCLTGGAHRGTKLHGFLAYLAHCAKTNTEYTIIGYKGKQVRDNLHAYDVATAIAAFSNNPKCGAVYNLGGGRENSLSVVEAIDMLERYLDITMRTGYDPTPRKGDHKWWITDTSNFQHDYRWCPSYDLADIIEDLTCDYI